jgi:Lon protease-like protein
MSDDFDPATLPEVVPIFPLPNLVMFPKALLPLHIFEMRYRAMTRDALAGNKLIAMATLVPGAEADYGGAPPIRPVGCVGRIMAEEALPDGRFNFVLHGLARVKFVLEFPPDPYRTAQIQALREITPDPAHATIMREALLGFFRIMAENAAVPMEPMQQLSSPSMPLGELTDLLSYFLPATPDVKQELLEELDIGRRAVKVATLLQEHVRKLGLKPKKRKFPSEPSMN